MCCNMGYRYLLRGLWCITFLLCATIVRGQSADSLARWYEQSPNDSVRISRAVRVAMKLAESREPAAITYANKIIELGEKRRNNEEISLGYRTVSYVYKSYERYAEALTAAQKSIALIKNTNDYASIGLAYNQLANVYYAQGQYSEAEANFLQALEMHKKVNDKQGIAQVYNNLGGVQNVMGNYSKAIEYLLESLRMKEASGDKKGISATCNNIANAYRKMGQYNKALEYQDRSLKIKEETNDVRGMSYSYSNIGNIYYNLKDTARALAYYQKALKLQLQLRDNMLIGNSYHSMGVIYSDKKQYELALKYMKTGLEYIKESQNLSALSSSYISLGEVHMRINELLTAEEYLKKGLEVAKKTGEKEDIALASRNLSELYSRTKEYEKSAAHLRQAQVMEDSLFNRETSRAVAEMQAKYEAEKKEASIRLLRKEGELKDARNRNTITLSLGLLGVLGLSGLFAYNTLRTRQQRRMEAERLAMQQQRLHAVLQTQEEERKRISAELHDGLGQMLSAVKLNMNLIRREDSQAADATRFQTAISLIDRSCEEVRTISHAMMPAMLVKRGLKAALQQMAAGISNAGGVQVTLDADELETRMPETTEVNLYRIIQEVLNNIVKYAVAGQVQIQFVKEAGELRVMIEDDGRGFDVQRLYQSEGNGWTNIQSRLDLLGGGIEIDSRPGQRGTVVFIHIPDSKMTVTPAPTPTSKA